MQWARVDPDSLLNISQEWFYWDQYSLQGDTVVSVIFSFFCDSRANRPQKTLLLAVGSLRQQWPLNTEFHFLNFLIYPSNIRPACHTLSFLMVIFWYFHSNSQKGEIHCLLACKNKEKWNIFKFKKLGAGHCGHDLLKMLNQFIQWKLLLINFLQLTKWAINLCNVRAVLNVLYNAG